MRHCSTEGYWPEHPGYTSPRARKIPVTLRQYALNHHTERLPEWIAWDSEFRTQVGGMYRGPDLVVVTRCRKGHLHTVIHLSDEPYPRP